MGTYATTSKSTALPVGTLKDAQQSKFDLSLTAGAAQYNSYIATSLAQTAHQDIYFGKFFSPVLAANAFSSATDWTIALATLEGNAAVNGFTTLSIYVLQSGDTVRGFIYDSDTPFGVEWTTTEDGQVFTLSGASVAGVTTTDRLVMEMWIHAVQSMATGYNNDLYFNGATPVTDTTTADAASYIEYTAQAAAAASLIYCRRPTIRNL